VETPLRPLAVALGAGGTFVARTTDVDIKHLTETLQRAAAHKGAAFIEVYQNCKIFNDEVFEYATDKSVKSDNTLILEHGKPLIFGKKRDKGIRINRQDFALETVQLGSEASTEDLLVHNEKSEHSTLAFLLAGMCHPEFPECMGVLRDVQQPTFDEQIQQQSAQALKARGGPGTLEKLFTSDDMWEVKASEATAAK